MYSCGTRYFLHRLQNFFFFFFFLNINHTCPCPCVPPPFFSFSSCAVYIYRFSQASEVDPAVKQRMITIGPLEPRALFDLAETYGFFAHPPPLPPPLGTPGSGSAAFGVKMASSSSSSSSSSFSGKHAYHVILRAITRKKKAVNFFARTGIYHCLVSLLPSELIFVFCSLGAFTTSVLHLLCLPFRHCQVRPAQFRKARSAKGSDGVRGLLQP